MFDRREYDKLRARKVYGDYKNRRKLLLEKLGYKCFLCEKDAPSNFHLHHLNYDNPESDYPRHARSMYIRLKRLSEAERFPERFSILCPRCHRALEGLKPVIKNWNKEKLINLLFD